MRDSCIRVCLTPAGDSAILHPRRGACFSSRYILSKATREKLEQMTQAVTKEETAPKTRTAQNGYKKDASPRSRLGMAVQALPLA